MPKISIEGKTVSLPGVDLFGHLYLVYDDGQGREFVISVHPTFNLPFAWGAMLAEDGENMLFSDDYRPKSEASTRGATEISFGDQLPSNVWSILVQFARQVNGLTKLNETPQVLEYDAFQQNSNAFINTALFVVGKLLEFNKPGIVENVLSYPTEGVLLAFDFKIDGTDGNDIIFGLEGIQTFTGGGGNDHLFGAAGNDVLKGGIGLDTISGGDDWDTAVYDGRQDQYRVEKIGSTYYVTDLIRPSDVDTLTGIENLRFLNTSGSIDGFLQPILVAHPTPVPVVITAQPTPADDHGGTTATATALGAGFIGTAVSASGIVGSATDHDYFAVQLQQDMTYTFFVAAKSTQYSLLDPSLVLWNTTGQTAITSDFGITNGPLSATIVFTASMSGTYYLDVGATGSTLGGYWILAADVSTPSAADDLISSPTPAGPGGNSTWDWQGTSGADSFPNASFTGSVNGDNRLRGHDGNDSIEGNGGNDVIWGDDGEDRLRGDAGNDTLLGGEDDDRLYGGTGDDSIHGEDGDDYLTGEDGDDYLHGGAQNDSMSGADGKDYLKGGSGDDSLRGGDQNDQLYGDEGSDELDGGSGDDILKGGTGSDDLDGDDGDDLLDGEDGDDLLWGNNGNDVIYGGDGNDRLKGGLGNDYLNGWSGIDWIDFNDGDSGVIVNLFDGRAASLDLGNDSFERIENVLGTNYDDQIDGNHDVNVLWGDSGDDIIRGHDGNDEIHGDSGDDVVWGDAGDDVVHGDSGDDEVRGGLGNDSLFGGTSDDLLMGEEGDDLIDGGDGVDKASFIRSLTAMNISLISMTATGEGTDTLVSIENLVGSNLGDWIVGSEANNEIFGADGNDLIVGNAGDDRLDGNQGIDTLEGGDGADVLFGGEGDDWLDGGLGDDYLNGWSGNDLIDYWGASSRVIVNLLQNYATGLATGADYVVEIEDVRATDFDDIIDGNHDANDLLGLEGDDQIRGHDGDDTLYGHDGNDTLWGDSGNDHVFGHSGNDKLRGGLGDDWLAGENGNDILMGEGGADRIEGNAGNDTASYSTAGSGVGIAMDGSFISFGDALGDLLVEVENLIGSRYNDKLAGNGTINALSGSDGNDLLYGRGGADRLTGGVGNDRLTGGTGADTLTGNMGHDRFYYATVIEGGDKCLDFSSAAMGNNDSVWFRGAGFGHLDKGKISSAQFQHSTSSTADTEFVRFFYETDTRSLWYDADGSGSESAAVKIVTLQADAVFTVDDILIV